MQAVWKKPHEIKYENKYISQLNLHSNIGWAHCRSLLFWKLCCLRRASVRTHSGLHCMQKNSQQSHSGCAQSGVTRGGQQKVFPVKELNRHGCELDANVPDRTAHL